MKTIFQFPSGRLKVVPLKVHMKYPSMESQECYPRVICITNVICSFRPCLYRKCNMGALYRMSLELLFMAKEETLIDDVNKKKMSYMYLPLWYRQTLLWTQRNLKMTGQKRASILDNSTCIKQTVAITYTS